jgi:hypothetical protein
MRSRYGILAAAHERLGQGGLYPERVVRVVPTTSDVININKVLQVVGHHGGDASAKRGGSSGAGPLG